MSLTYATYTNALVELLNLNTSANASFQVILPDAIDYAEQRIQRELNLLSTVVRDASSSLAPGSRNFTLPTAQGIFVVVNGLNAITPAGTAPDNGTRIPLQSVSRDYLDMVWPSVSGSAVPASFAMLTQTAVLVGPWPDQAYTVEVVGTQRATPLSANNPVTFISQNLPDLFLAASMVFMSAYQQDFGAQSDDPQQAQSWEAQTSKLMQSASTEEARKRFMGSAWSSYSDGPEAQPART